MRRSSERIITTHTGSLPRPGKVVDLLLAEKKGADTAALDAAVRAAIDEVVQRQIAAGIDVINDGEQAVDQLAVVGVVDLGPVEGDRRNPAAVDGPKHGAGGIG